MKASLLLLLAVVIALPATATSPPTFTARLGELPPLSLAEAAKGSLESSVVGNWEPQPAALRAVAGRERKPISAMPIIPPPAGFRSNMPVLTPNPAVDYKLIIKEPVLEVPK